MSYASPKLGVAASSGSQTPFMQTVLSEFCDSFQKALRPILDPVQEAADALAEAPEDLEARRVLPAVRDLRHQMQTLVDKVGEQQAYVLIFGPLKSGKSTFMNALSAAYVSEVTSLPAYPCMVYVKHSETPGFEVSHYDGRTTTVKQRDALRDVVASGHHDLTRRIREVEAGGEVFDPAVHMPEAIRKIDIKIGIDDLAQSGAVLVDTPGLYTRMKFGYDRMTRDFRNAAACAIFIVKTDNLFLEQVFDEFGELLELFSRIFLVVNVDSTKKDLLPDGTLAPSLEQTSPWEVIEAFEHLSMTAPLKEAFEEGRLEIYPVDLLRAASKRILPAGLDDGSTADEPEAGSSANGDGRGQTDFDDVLRDLTEFLNSNEYLKAFLDDSLRRSRTLIDELDTALRDETVQQLGREVAMLQEGRDDARAKAETVERLREVPWRENAQGLGPALLDRVAGLKTQVKADAAGPVYTAVDKWFEESHSLDDLLNRELLPTFASTHTRLARETEEALKRRAAEDPVGLAGSVDVLTDLLAVGVDLRKTAAAALDHLKDRAAATSPRPRLSSEDIPVRRSVSDWFMLRSGSKVRRRLFGPEEQPDAEISPAVKAARLGEPARESMRTTLTSQLASLLDEAAGDLPDQMIRGYAERFEEDLQSELEREQIEANQRLEQIERRLGEVQQAHGSLHALSGQIGSFSSSVDSLIDKFGQTDPATLTEQAV